MLGTELVWRSCGRGLWRSLCCAAGGSPRALSAASSSACEGARGGGAPPAGSRAVPSLVSLPRRVFRPGPACRALRNCAGGGCDRFAECGRSWTLLGGPAALVPGAAVRDCPGPHLSALLGTSGR